MSQAAATRLPEVGGRSELATALRRLSQHAMEAIVMMGSDGVITGWNARSTALFGWAPDEAIGRTAAETIIPARYRASHLAGLRRYLATGTGAIMDRPVDIAALHRDGHEFPVELSVTAIAEGDGLTFVAFVRDVSEKRAIERALRDTEARYRSLVEQLPGIAYVDELGGMGRFVSPQVEPILGYTPEEWLADDGLWLRSIHPEDRDRAQAELAAGQRRGGTFTLIYRLIARDGRVVWIRDQATVRHDEASGTTVSGLMLDVSREVGTQAQLEVELAERREISESLQRLPHARPVDETAAVICHELARLRHVDVAIVYEFAHDGSVVPLGFVGPPGMPIRAGQPLPSDHATYLQQSATGPWIDELRARSDATDHERAWLEAGLHVAAYVPFGSGETAYGLLAVGSLKPIGTADASRWLPSVTEFGAITAALLVPALGSRREQEGTRAELTSIIRDAAFAPVFQPIVRLSDEVAVGFEALTRFADGTPPDRWFGVAHAAGVGAELEGATMRAALEAASALPGSTWLSVNVSPPRLLDAGFSRLVTTSGRRRLVLEITERLAIDDYAAARGALDRLARHIDVAVDDAGAGFSSLRHIIELRPRYVKLDMQLIRGVDGDPARQAMIAGMVFFARDAGCQLIAEGIETAGERDMLRHLGVPLGQGYFFGRPAPAATWR